MGANASMPSAVTVVLAAGLARRMGQAKPSLPWNGITLLDYVVQTASCVETPVVTVVDHRVRPTTAFWVENPDPSQGVASSIQTGVRWVRDHWGAVPVQVLLADQPFVTADDIRRVWDAFEARPDSVHAVRPFYDGIPGHPVAFDARFDAVIFSLAGDRGLGAVWASRPEVMGVPVAVGKSRPHPATDIDTPADYQQALAWLAQQSE
ncbi:MAG: nucleotidyltransferase family protein [Sulfobacillus sp.]|nr:nucleotidyltransferase family protein [Sulfobacillus sp.]